MFFKLNASPVTKSHKFYLRNKKEEDHQKSLIFRPCSAATMSNCAVMKLAFLWIGMRYVTENSFIRFMRMLEFQLGLLTSESCSCSLVDCEEVKGPALSGML